MRPWVQGHAVFLAVLSAAVVQAADNITTQSDSEPTHGQNDTLLPHDPAGFLEMCLEQGPPRVKDFRCTFIQNELLGKKLSGKQVIDALYRREPRSVFLRWITNPQGAKRTLWIKGRNLAKDGTEQLRIEPAGAADLIVKNLLLKMNDHRVVKDERQPITAFGPDATLERIVRENRQAKQAGHLDLHYHGPATFDGRPTHQFIRKLPYSGPQGAYLDGLMILHIDQALLIPLSVTSYADHDRKNLLESDEFTKLQANVGLSDADFKF